MAHRGAPHLRAENTLPSFAAALQAGADVLELDVRCTRDGVLVVVHDPNLTRTTVGGLGAVAELDYADVAALPVREPAGVTVPLQEAAHVPRFIDVLRAFPQASFNVDLKAVPLPLMSDVVRALREARRAPGALQDVLLTSSDGKLQRELDRLLEPGEARRGMGRYDVLQLLAAVHLRRDPIERLRGRACQVPMFHNAHALGLHVCLPVVTDRLIAYLRVLESPLHVWWDEKPGIDDPALARTLYRRGVDAIVTDAIETMAPALTDLRRQRR